MLDAPVSRGEIYAVDARTGNGKRVFGYRAGEMQTGSRVRRGTADRAWGYVVDTLRRRSPRARRGDLDGRRGRDRRAPLEHAKRMRAALAESGNAPEWLVEKKEGHGFYDERARERMYARVVAFLREATAPR